MALHLSKLNHYKITPKGMLQIYINQEIPYEVLRLVFQDALMME